MTRTYKRKLLLGVSFLAIGTLSYPASGLAQTCNGVQARSTQCVDSNGTAVADSYCTGNGLSKPATSQDCTYYCPPPPPPPSGDGSGDGGGCCDTTGDSRNDNTQGRGSQGFGPSDNKGQSSSSGGDGGSSGGRVICTYFFIKGELCKDYYYADFEYTLSKIHPNTVRGYHFWAIPYAEKLYKKSGGILEKIMRPVTINRAEELAYQMGVRSEPNYLGKFFRLLIEPLCFVIGSFVQEKDYSKLYTKEHLIYLSTKYQKYRFEREENKKMAGTPLASFTI